MAVNITAEVGDPSPTFLSRLRGGELFDRLNMRTRAFLSRLRGGEREKWLYQYRHRFLSRLRGGEHIMIYP